MIIIEREKEPLIVSKKQYSNKRVALTCTDSEHEPYATLTVNLINEDIQKDHAFIDTNNHKWAIKSLKDAGIITGDALRFAKSGYCEYPLYKINL